VSEEARETATQPALVQALLRLRPREQQRLLEWARGVGAIRYGALRGGEKLRAMLALTREKEALWPLAKVMALALRHVLWDARSWKVRLGVGAVIAIFVAIGNEAPNIVDLGGGIGLPLWMLIAGGATAAGSIADRVKARVGKRHTGSQPQTDRSDPKRRA
jgi:hypothetical protein